MKRSGLKRSGLGLKRSSFKSKGSGLRSKSNKRAKEDKVYLALRKDFLLDFSECQGQAVGNGCSFLKLCPSTEIHHMKGRAGENYLDTENWLAVGRRCHTFITENHSLAVEKGLSKPRHENRDSTR
jgi:hypothetical protein